MSHTIIGMFSTAAAAATARERLVAAGIPAADIRTSGSSTATASTGTVTAEEDKGFWASVKEMFSGDEYEDPDREVGYYTQGASRGGVVLTVDADESEAETAASILQAAGAVDIDDEARRQSATTGRAATTATSATAGATAASGKVDVVREDLNVGKRVVNRGGVRIVKKVIERPFEQDVTLREERVTVGRTATNRALHGDELEGAFKDQTIELSESAEEAVTSKVARVVGEVVVGKTVQERTQKVRDTLRETDVQVEKVAAGSSTESTSGTVRTDTNSASNA